ncbi:hypothetical protein [Mucilaginibacter jinjuensis]|uniref:Uncharacterized protein n=1 Tax=Mucilaginibacter jinjuensis TaxID=1176721 RepID=A0ABY7T4H1_9SPHI|nr:hypothetical protein [Mucilaginibacter jinjuensis]WCT11184.1 hypothetical protein PQO05_20810 [Mucilaginibacter jinjuensis]
MKRAILICFIALISLFKTFAQTNADKYDVVVKTTGDEMVGKITEINEDNIKFTYKGETLSYTVKKADIAKVTFASGRVEIFNQPQTQPNLPVNPAQAAPADTKNQVAILPFGLIVGGQPGSEAMQTQIQNDCYTNFAQKAVSMKFQDPANTNVILFRNNVTPETIKGYTMDDLCHMLGVEYLVTGVVTLNHASSTTTGGGSSTSTTKKTDSKDKTTTYSSGSSSSYDNYTTIILMNIYDHGTKIFTKSHQAFWPGVDAYKVTLSYLAKRTPIYNK